MNRQPDAPALSAEEEAVATVLTVYDETQRLNRATGVDIFDNIAAPRAFIAALEAQDPPFTVTSLDRERAASSGEGLTFVNPKFRAFVERAAEVMERRLEHGRAKFGSDWDEKPYPDDRNEERIRRAVDHLVAARASSPDPEEWRKRAADVANQAFMYADPERVR